MADLGTYDPANALSGNARISSITYDFNRIGAETGTSDHGFLTFHMADGSVQTLGGHPAGASGDLTLLSHADVTDPRGLTARFDVSVPPGMTADSYARSLVRAAENYNTHPLPYSPIGEEGYNSTSSTSSLLAHVGGKTAVADLKRIASDIGVSTHIETNDGIPRPRGDLAGIAAIDVQTMRGREVATGLDHASIPKDRFERGSVTPAHERGMGSFELHAEAIEAQVINIPNSVQQEMGEAGVRADRAIGYRPSTLQYQRDGKTVETRAYQQRGHLLEVDEFTVTQDTGRGGRAVYSRAELERAAGGNVDALNAQLVPGNVVQFNYSNSALSAQTIQGQGLERGTQPQHQGLSR